MLSKVINNSNFSTMFVPSILRDSHLQAQLHASVVRMHAETKSRPPGIMSKEQLESLSRNKFTTNKVLSYRPKDDDVTIFWKKELVRDKITLWPPLAGHLQRPRSHQSSDQLVGAQKMILAATSSFV